MPQRTNDQQHVETPVLVSVNRSTEPKAPQNEKQTVRVRVVKAVKLYGKLIMKFASYIFVYASF